MMQPLANQVSAFGLSDKELDVVTAVLDMGGSISIAILIVVALALIAWKLSGPAVKFTTDLVRVMQSQAEATSRQADANAGQASAMNEMKDSLSKYILKDNNEHREILLGLEVTADKLGRLTQAVTELKQ